MSDQTLQRAELRHLPPCYDEAYVIYRAIVSVYGYRVFLPRAEFSSKHGSGKRVIRQLAS